MKGGKLVQIAYHMLESSIGVYIEGLANELTMIFNKIEYKDAPLIMLPTVAITHEPDSLAYPWSLFFLPDG
jgi:hypothetical protein